MKLIIKENDIDKIVYENVNCEINFSSKKEELELKFLTDKIVIKYVIHADEVVKSIFDVLKLVSEHISKDFVTLRDDEERYYVHLKGNGCECEDQFTAQKYIDGT